VKRSLSVLIAAAPLLLAAPTASAQVPPPTLTGESLTGTTTTTTSATCDPGGTSTFSYQTSGVAAGPYNGTFTETGTVTVGPQPIPANTFSAPGGIVMSWTASFTITSATPAATITGTKSLLPPPPGFSADVVGVCEDGTRGIDGFPHFPPQQFAGNVFSQQLLGYTATITVGGEQFRDTGTSRAAVSVTVTAAGTFFLENYTSSQAATIPLCDEDAQINQNQVNNDQGCANP